MVGAVLPAVITRPKAKPRTVVGLGRNLSSYRFNHQQTKIGSQRYLRSLPAHRLPVNFPTKARECCGPRRDSNPHLVAGRANVRPLHHGPSVASEGSADLNKVARHIRSASVPIRESSSPQTPDSASLTYRAQGDIIFQAYISSLTIRDSVTRRRRNAAADVF